MNRRFFMRWLGIAPVAALVAVAVICDPERITGSFGAPNDQASFTLDLMPDGTSRVIVDASAFEIRADSGMTYPFRFDGATMHVPNLTTAG
ncbi:hypothetical protein HCU64_06475 [Methylobacterium sp. C25]|uniref:hypothetical protein n=1 Tax=Methylobacterium sp. C25 TaxID=2721622 RepID=UPI001F1A9E00|nr:hypothetical protein [Methylobacterium sp. C25]MCE4223391.1 hypothetical protein [Methylobacterium sp. C25]